MYGNLVQAFILGAPSGTLPRDSAALSRWFEHLTDPDTTPILEKHAFYLQALLRGEIFTAVVQNPMVQDGGKYTFRNGMAHLTKLECDAVDLLCESMARSFRLDKCHASQAVDQLLYEHYESVCAEKLGLFASDQTGFVGVLKGAGVSVAYGHLLTLLVEKLEAPANFIFSVSGERVDDAKNVRQYIADEDALEKQQKGLAAYWQRELTVLAKQSLQVGNSWAKDSYDCYTQTLGMLNRLLKMLTVDQLMLVCARGLVYAPDSWSLLELVLTYYTRNIAFFRASHLLGKCRYEQCLMRQQTSEYLTRRMTALSAFERTGSLNEDINLALKVGASEPILWMLLVSAKTNENLKVRRKADRLNFLSEASQDDHADLVSNFDQMLLQFQQADKPTFFAMFLGALLIPSVLSFDNGHLIPKHHDFSQLREAHENSLLNLRDLSFDQQYIASAFQHDVKDSVPHSQALTLLVELFRFSQFIWIKKLALPITDDDICALRSAETCAQCIRLLHGVLQRGLREAQDKDNHISFEPHFELLSDLGKYAQNVKSTVELLCKAQELADRHFPNGAQELAQEEAREIANVVEDEEAMRKHVAAVIAERRMLYEAVREYMDVIAERRKLYEEQEHLLARAINHYEANQVETWMLPTHVDTTNAVYDTIVKDYYCRAYDQARYHGSTAVVAAFVGAPYEQVLAMLSSHRDKYIGVLGAALAAVRDSQSIEYTPRLAARAYQKVLSLSLFAVYRKQDKDLAVLPRRIFEVQPDAGVAKQFAVFFKRLDALANNGHAAVLRTQLKPYIPGALVERTVGEHTAKQLLARIRQFCELVSQEKINDLFPSLGQDVMALMGEIKERHVVHCETVFLGQLEEAISSAFAKELPKFSKIGKLVRYHQDLARNHRDRHEAMRDLVGQHVKTMLEHGKEADFLSLMQALCGDKYDEQAFKACYQQWQARAGFDARREQLSEMLKTPTIDCDALAGCLTRWEKASEIISSSRVNLPEDISRYFDPAILSQSQHPGVVTGDQLESLLEDVAGKIDKLPIDMLDKLLAWHRHEYERLTFVQVLKGEFHIPLEYACRPEYKDYVRQARRTARRLVNEELPHVTRSLTHKINEKRIYLLGTQMAQSDTEAEREAILKRIANLYVNGHDVLCAFLSAGLKDDVQVIRLLGYIKVEGEKLSANRCFSGSELDQLVQSFFLKILDGFNAKLPLVSDTDIKQQRRHIVKLLSLYTLFPDSAHAALSAPLSRDCWDVLFKYANLSDATERDLFDNFRKAYCQHDGQHALDILLSTGQNPLGDSAEHHHRLLSDIVRLGQQVPGGLKLTVEDAQLEVCAKWLDRLMLLNQKSHTPIFSNHVSVCCQVVAQLVSADTPPVKRLSFYLDQLPEAFFIAGQLNPALSDAGVQGDWVRQVIGHRYKRLLVKYLPERIGGRALFESVRNLDTSGLEVFQAGVRGIFDQVIKAQGRLPGAIRAHLSDYTMLFQGILGDLDRILQPSSPHTHGATPFLGAVSVNEEHVDYEGELLANSE